MEAVAEIAIVENSLMWRRDSHVCHQIQRPEDFAVQRAAAVVVVVADNNPYFDRGYTFCLDAFFPKDSPAVEFTVSRIGFIIQQGFNSLASFENTFILKRIDPMRVL